MKKNFLLFIVALLLHQMANTQSTFFVNATTGSDITGDGSSGAPFKTFYKGYTTATAGDILDVAGTFSWTDADETGDAITTGFSIQKNLTVRGQSAASTIFQAATTANSADRRVFTVDAGISFTLIDATVRYGYVNTGVNYDGGAGIKNAGSLYLDGCLITENRTHTGGSQMGAGILTAGSGSATIVGSTISSNSTTGSNGWGAAMAHGNYGTPGALIMKNCMIRDNSTGNGRGSFMIMLTGSAINKITNCTFYNNSAPSYGGLWVDRANVVFTNCTIVGNPNGGLNVYGSSVYLKNNLMANNTSYDFGITISASVVDNGYNLVETSLSYTFSGTGDITGDQSSLNIDASPATNSTLVGTQTIALQSGSVAINAGNGSIHGPAGNQVTPFIFDQRNYGRDGSVDIGAYEYNGTPSYAWFGAKSSNWNDAENWRTKTVPSGSFNLIMHPVKSFNPLILHQDINVGIFDCSESVQKVQLGNYNLTAASSTAGNANCYAQTNGTGKLKMNITNGNSLLYPVGNSVYNPVNITNNSGATDEFAVKVRDEVLEAGISGNPITGDYVQRTWDITKLTANGGAGVNFIFYWNSGDKTNNITTPALFHYGTGWTKQTGTTSSTATSLTYTGYTGTFSPFAVMDGSIALPVTGLHLAATGKAGSVMLQWTTLTESNSHFFTIQRSTPNGSWVNIGNIKAAGNSTALQRYNYTDNQPLKSAQYRLIQTDKDGKTSYSNIVSIQFTDNIIDIRLQNPFTNDLRFNMLPSGKSYQVQVYKNDGQLMYKGKALNGTILSTTHWPSGMYMVQITDENGNNQQQKILKQ